MNEEDSYRFKVVEVSFLIATLTAIVISFSRSYPIAMLFFVLSSTLAVVVAAYFILTITYFREHSYELKKVSADKKRWYYDVTYHPTYFLIISIILFCMGIFSLLFEMRIALLHMIVFISCIFIFASYLSYKFWQSQKILSTN